MSDQKIHQNGYTDVAPNTSAPLPVGSTLELEVDSLAVGGRGVARHDGLVIFVEQALPGQRIMARITSSKSRMAEAELLQVIRPGKDDIAPECPHFGVCGGCDWQHLDYQAQLLAKHQIFCDCLIRLGRQDPVKIQELAIPPTVSSPKLWHFRNKMEFAFAPGGALVPGEAASASGSAVQEAELTDTPGKTKAHYTRPLLGLRRRGSHSVEEVTQCRLQSPLTMRILEITRKWLEEETSRGQFFNVWEEPRRRDGKTEDGLPSLREKKRRGSAGKNSGPDKTADFPGGALRHMVIREPELTVSADLEKDNGTEGSQVAAQKKQCLVELITTPFSKREAGIFKRLGLRIMQELKAEQDAEPASRDGQLAFGFVHSVRADPANVAQGEKIIQTLGLETLTEDFGELRLSFGAQSFMQTNTGAATLLMRQAADWALQTAQTASLKGKPLVIWDLYCGVGAFSLSLAQAAQQHQDVAIDGIFGLELSRKAVHDAIENAKANGLKNCRFLSGDAEKILHDPTTKEWPRPNLVLLDPPRGGLREKLCKTLMALGPEHVLLVSCNPATLGRDLAMLSNKYETVKAGVFDLFPHSSHLESMVLLRKKA